MDKWHNQFDKLKKQWSDYNRINSDYKLHDKRQVAKLGVAWVIKLPGQYFNKPVGWEVEIIDTPLGISERSNKLLKWLRHPPTNAYDNISVFDDSSDILLGDDEFRQETGYKRKYEHSSSFNETQQQFQVPPNEYEIFKKTCCECREKSFKNTSTDYDSDIRTSRLNQKHVPYSLQPKNSYFDLPPSKTLENDQELSSIVNRSLYSDFEQELQNEVLNEPIQSTIRQTEEPKYSNKFSTPKNDRRNFPKINQSIETSKVLSDMHPQQNRTLKNGHRASTNGGSPIHNHLNDNNIVAGDTKNAHRSSINGGLPIQNHQNAGTIVGRDTRNDPQTSIKRRGSPIHNDNIIVEGGTRNAYRTNINEGGSPIHNHPNNNTMVRGHTRNGTVISPTTHNRNVSPHIPSIDAFDDNIITRGSSLEQYRNTDHIFHPSKDDDLTFRERRMNGHRNHHHHNHHRRHGHRRNRSRDASIDTVPEDNVFPEFEPSEIREEFDEKEQTIIGN